MVGCGFVVFMQLLEIINEVVNSLCIKELYVTISAWQGPRLQFQQLTHLTYHLGRFCVVDSLEILLHSGIIILLLVKIISIFPEY